MEVKTFFLLMTVMCTCTAESGDSFAVKTETASMEDDLPYGVESGYEEPTGVRNSIVGRVHEQKNIESNEPALISEGLVYRVYMETMSYEELYPLIVNCTAHECNSTDQDAVKHNWTKPILKLYTISDDAVLFLKGLLVTRVMPSFYIFLFIISLPLNALALLTFTCKIKEKKPAVIYMSQLACVDLLFTLLLPLKIHYHLNGSHWVFGEAACRVLSAAFYCYMYCSILLMMCMSVDRLVAVVLPIASLTWRSRRNSVYVCVLVWLLALAGTVPLVFITQTFKIKNVGITCHDVLYHTQLYSYLFFILSCVYFFLPLVVTLACYSTIIYVLSAKPDRLATSSSTSDNRKRAVIMLIAVLTEFVVCFTPSNGILFYHCIRLATGGHAEEGKYYVLAVCAGSSSVLLDPLLYYYGSSQFRQQIRSVFWWRKNIKSDTYTQ